MKNPDDARYCPSCGEELPVEAVTLYADDTINRYRASFGCGECGYQGEVIRAGGISDMSLSVVVGEAEGPSPNASSCERRADDA